MWMRDMKKYYKGYRITARKDESIVDNDKIYLSIIEEETNFLLDERLINGNLSEKEVIEIGMSKVDKEV